MEWTDEAKTALERVPGFVRSMAKRAVEKDVRSQGRSLVTAEDVARGHQKHIAFAEEKKDEPAKTRIAVVRCETVSEVCPGVACFKAFYKRHSHFSGYGDNTEIIGFVTCGGCPGRRVSRLIDSLKKHGLDAVHLSSCMMLEGDYPACPHVRQIKAMIESKGIKVVEGTHH